MALLMVRSMPCIVGSECQHGPDNLIPFENSGSDAYTVATVAAAWIERVAIETLLVINHHLCPACFEKSGHNSPSPSHRKGKRKTTKSEDG